MRKPRKPTPIMQVSKTLIAFLKINLHFHVMTHLLFLITKINSVSTIASYLQQKYRNMLSK